MPHVHVVAQGQEGHRSVLVATGTLLLQRDSWGQWSGCCTTTVLPILWTASHERLWM